MALGSTITLTVDAVARVLTDIRSGEPYTGEYLLRTTTFELRMKVRHSKAKNASKTNIAQQDRHNLELTCTTFPTATTPEYIEKMYFVTQADPGRTAIGLAAAVFSWAVAASNANLAKLDGWES